MTAHRYARAERQALCDLLERLGPDQPTLCEGWTTRDLAAHLVVRERRPLAAAGIMLAPLAGHGERVRRAYAGRDFPVLLAALRRPPRWTFSGWRRLDELANGMEMFIHHEDVRRAQPEWQPRMLPPEQEAALWRMVAGFLRLRLRRFPATVVIDAGEGRTRQAGAGGPTVRVAGPPGELAMFFSGRQRAARVTVEGPDDLVQRLSTADLGI